MNAMQVTMSKRWLKLREGEAYMCTLAPRRILMLLREDDGTWCLWWGQYAEEQWGKPIKERTLASGLSFEAALKRGEEYLDWWFEQRKKGGKA